MLLSPRSAESRGWCCLSKGRTKGRLTQLLLLQGAQSPSGRHREGRCPQAVRTPVSQACTSHHALQDQPPPRPHGKLPITPNPNEVPKKQSSKLGPRPASPPRCVLAQDTVPLTDLCAHLLPPPPRLGSRYPVLCLCLRCSTKAWSWAAAESRHVRKVALPPGPGRRPAVRAPRQQPGVQGGEEGDTTLSLLLTRCASAPGRSFTNSCVCRMRTQTLKEGLAAGEVDSG